MADLRIALTEINGEQCIDPGVMDILHEFTEHRELCDQCAHFFTFKCGTYCPTGHGLIERLLEHPDVSIVT